MKNMYQDLIEWLEKLKIHLESEPVLDRESCYPHSWVEERDYLMRIISEELETFL